MPPKFHGKFFRLFSGTIIPSPRNAGVASPANRIPFRRRPLQSIRRKSAYSLTPTGNSLRRAIFATSLHHRFVGHILSPIFRFVNNFLTKNKKNTSLERDVEFSQNTDRDRKRRRNTFVKGPAGNNLNRLRPVRSTRDSNEISESHYGSP